MTFDRREIQVSRLAEFWTRQKEAGNVNNAKCIEDALRKSIKLSEEALKRELVEIGI